MAKLGNPQETIQVLQKHDFHFQKKFGQNFLIDPHVLDKIIEAAEVTKDDFVLEIGPGIGTMTQYLCEAARQVLAVEIDNNLIRILQETLSPYDNVEILHGDILKQDIHEIAEKYNDKKPIKVVANLPYYITTPIIMGLWRAACHLRTLPLWCRKKWLNVCRQSRAQKNMVHCRLPCSITQNRIWRRMFRQTVLCRGLMLEVR